MSIRQSIVQQFKHPRGMLGSLAGFIMANRSSNIERNQWMLEMVELHGDDKVLEIGFGPGLALEGALKIVDTGLVVGIDHSDTMYQQARRRNSAAIAQGRARLMVADIQTGPGFDIKFDHIYSANVVQFWQNPVEVYAYLKTLLSSEGDVTTLLMPRNKGATNKDTHAFAEDIQVWLDAAGFSSVETRYQDFAGLDAVCIKARP